MCYRSILKVTFLIVLIHLIENVKGRVRRILDWNPNSSRFCHYYKLSQSRRVTSRSPVVPQYSLLHWSYFISDNPLVFPFFYT